MKANPEALLLEDDAQADARLLARPGLIGLGEDLEGHRDLKIPLHGEAADQARGGPVPRIARR